MRKRYYIVMSMTVECDPLYTLEVEELALDAVIDALEPFNAIVDGVVDISEFSEGEEDDD
jgi:hypothetical protein